MTPKRYLLPSMIAQRRRAMAWIMAHRPRFQPSASYSLSESPARQGIACYALAPLRDTPAFVARSWVNGDIPATVAQTGIAASIGLAFGCMFGLAW